jgi:hypothetical protein
LVKAVAEIKMFVNCTMNCFYVSPNSFPGSFHNHYLKTTWSFSASQRLAIEVIMLNAFQLNFYCKEKKIIKTKKV